MSIDSADSCHVRGLEQTSGTWRGSGTHTTTNKNKMRVCTMLCIIVAAWLWTMMAKPGPNGMQQRCSSRVMDPWPVSSIVRARTSSLDISRGCEGHISCAMSASWLVGGNLSATGHVWTNCAIWNTSLRQHPRSALGAYSLISVLSTAGSAVFTDQPEVVVRNPGWTEGTSEVGNIPCSTLSFSPGGTCEYISGCCAATVPSPGCPWPKSARQQHEKIL